MTIEELIHILTELKQSVDPLTEVYVERDNRDSAPIGRVIIDKGEILIEFGRIQMQGPTERYNREEEHIKARRKARLRQIRIDNYLHNISRKYDDLTEYDAYHAEE